MSNSVIYRKPQTVMNLTRLGSLHQTRLSFSRSILRKAFAEQWKIILSSFNLDDNGYGTVVYRLETEDNIYNCVIFSDKLADHQRSDRVIAEAWDVTFALINGEADKAMIEQLRQNVPLQEAGRNNPRVLVLSRANRSMRNFSYITDCLRKGHQPDPQQIAQVGYLYRTTAVYGNGKFGIADYKLLQDNDDFARPFAAQMFTIYLLRDFCIRQVEHIAKKSSHQSVELAPELKRYLGIGNSTGLGMAPFLINHPALTARWVLALETAIARCSAQIITEENQSLYLKILKKAAKYFQETTTADVIQQVRYQQVSCDIEHLLLNLEKDHKGQIWGEILSADGKTQQFESHELFNTILLELFPELSNALCDEMADAEQYHLDASMRLSDVKKLIECHYYWALDYNFSDQQQYYWFWYYSEEKEEPRLGVRGQEAGEDKQMPLGIAWRVQRFYKLINEFSIHSPDAYLADFLLLHTDKRGIARRIQSMSHYTYSEIQANVFEKNLRPLDLLRAKLSFLGASKFDPKSDKWVRVTLFQGAPTLDELSSENFDDDWYFTLAPNLKGSS
ncbi:MAG: hypothetical protein ACWIPH_04860 [Ostreibacterium sp.]